MSSPGKVVQPNVVFKMEGRSSGERAAEINPNLVEVHANLGQTYLQCKPVKAVMRQLQWGKLGTGSWETRGQVTC
jgi:hypothetical protein